MKISKFKIARTVILTRRMAEKGLIDYSTRFLAFAQNYLTSSAYFKSFILNVEFKKRSEVQ